MHARNARKMNRTVELNQDCDAQPRAPYARVFMIVVIAVGLYLLPGRERIAPVIAGDNVYIFQAADRFHDGEGITALPPVAPLQPWEYTKDWTFLTKWPIGYPLLLAGVRRVLGIGTVEASQVINVLGCALALVGWFAWLRCCLRSGLVSIMLSGLGAASAVSTSTLVNPATDTLLIALLPWVLLAANWMMHADRLRGLKSAVQGESENIALPTNSFGRWLVVGLAAGALLWFRYAAIFVCAGIGAYLLGDSLIVGRARLRRLIGFGVGAAVPLATLFALNASQTSSGSVQEQINLGSSVGFDFSMNMPTTAWMLWTQLPFYDHKWYSHWFFALVVPSMPIVFAIFSKPYRVRYIEFLRQPAVLMSFAVVAALFVTLVSASTLFAGKFDYVALERYYLPIRPLYFVLMIGPLLWLRPIALRAGLAISLLIGCSWMVQQEWPRPYRRWLTSRTEATTYQRWATTFAPNSRELYDWIAEQSDEALIVFSNFHDELTLETGQPFLPLPRSQQQMTNWLVEVRDARRLDEPRVLFVIDPDYHNREYYLPSLPDTVATFGLVQAKGVPESVARFVYTLPAAAF